MQCPCCEVYYHECDDCGNYVCQGENEDEWHDVYNQTIMKLYQCKGKGKKQKNSHYICGECANVNCSICGSELEEKL